MTGEEFTAMNRAYGNVRVMTDRLAHWRLSPETKEMFGKVFDLLRDSQYQEALELSEKVLAQGKAFAEGYDIISIMLDRRLSDDMAEFFAQPRIIEENHYLDQGREIIYYEGETFQIEHCKRLRRKDHPRLCVSGDRVVYRGRRVDASAGEILVAPWNDLDRMKKRKFSMYKPFLGMSRGPQDTYGRYSYDTLFNY